MIMTTLVRTTVKNTCLRTMKRFFKLWNVLTLGLMMSLFGNLATAAGEQFYFIGMVAPLESFTNSSGAQAVYLRWDEVEGQLPADLDQIILQRDGVEIYRTDAVRTPSTSEINSFYQGDTQHRRRLEMINGLNQVASSETPARVINQSNFANEIASKIQTDRYWASLVSRIDINVARARGRAFLDESTTAGSHEYELIGESVSQEKIRLGRVTVETGLQNVVPAGVNFRQLQEFSRCDAPEFGKQHGSVVLNWDHGGEHSTDRYINGLMIAGFDIYRSTQAGPLDAGLDIRQLAAGSNYDTQGVPNLPGLVKLNELPIMIGGTAERETSKIGWNAEFSKFLETYPEIKAAGLTAGESRAYYLVARDITGNYGLTKGLEVNIPDLVAPPAPWDVHQITNMAVASVDGAFRLRFSQVNVANFVNDNGYNRRWCNLDSARLDKRLTFVKQGQFCEAQLRQEVALEVDAYLVYRFDGIEQAKSFSDSDGDGYADLDERSPNIENPDLSSPGTACVVNGPGLGPANYLIDSIPSTASYVNDHGRSIIDYIDTVPANDRGQVYWYRFASRALDGKVGHLSVPVRGHFPDRKREQIVPNGEGGDGIIGVLDCDYQVESVAGNASNFFAEDTTGDAYWASLVCLLGENSGTMLTLPIVQSSQGRGADLSPANCRDHVETCPGGLLLGYLDSLGVLLAGGTIGLPKLNSCPQNDGTKLTKPILLPPQGTPAEQCKNPSARPIRPGEILDADDIFIDLNAVEPDTCLVISRDIGGEPFRIAQFCPPFAAAPELPLDGLGGASICLSVSLSNENNELSVPYKVPCFTLPTDGAPDAPQIYQAAFDVGEMTVSFRPPEQPVAGTLFEWFQKGGVKGRSTEFKSHPGSSQADGSIEADISIGAAPSGLDWQQEWCVRGRSVGTQPGPGEQGGNLSDWSPLLCSIRLPVGDALPEFLPWPKISLPKEVASLESVYLESDGLPVIEIGNPVDLEGRSCLIDQIPVCVPDDKGSSCLETSAACDETICDDLPATLKGGLGFVVYRQTAAQDPSSVGIEVSDFVQVSPLIDHINCLDFTVSDNIIVSGLVDPYLKFLYRDSEGENKLKVYFADEVPHISENWYRHQLVYFDGQGEILNYRNTQWIQAKQ